jgi:hypothetical protein
MDKSLQSFLHPHRKPNIKFRLPAFDEEFEMRPLSVDETMRIDKEASEKGWKGSEVLHHYAAESLVKPNLRNKELQDALAEKVGHKILNPYDAYRSLFNGPEAAAIAGKYVEIANLGISFTKRVEEAKKE